MTHLNRLLLLVAIFLGFATNSRADFIVGLLSGGRFVTFDSATPGTTSAPITITGLRTSEEIIGIDFRPSTPGVLVGVGVAGGTGFVYTIDTTTGAATAINTSGIPGLSTAFGIDFNPVPNALRILGGDRSNIRITAGGAGAVAVDTPLSQTNVSAPAYSNNFAGATTTTLYALDTVNSALVRIGGLNGPPSPNLGQVTTIGPLGVDARFGFADLDISDVGTAYALLSSNTGARELHTVNLGTGQATLVGTIGNNGLFDIAVAPTSVAVPTPTGMVLMMLGVGLLAIRRKRGLNKM
jgi:Domain of unknown function (DUF4394)